MSRVWDEEMEEGRKFPMVRAAMRNKYVGPPYHWAEMYTGRTTC